MENIIRSLINILFYPVTSRSFFFFFLAMMCFVMAIWSLIGRMVRGRF